MIRLAETICERCGKQVSEESMPLHLGVCRGGDGYPKADTPEDVAAHRMLIDEIRALTGPARAPTKAELRQAAINAIKRLIQKGPA